MAPPKIKIVSLILVISIYVLLPLKDSHSNHVCSDDLPIPESEALAALELWTFERAYPGNSINDRAYTDEYNKIRKEMKSLETGAAAQWYPIGPLNRGGRMISLAFNPLNPNTLYAGSASGGLWRSYSAGVGELTWERVETGYPVLGVGAIAFPADDSLTIFIGTGEVYRYEESTGGLDQRTYRGSYGTGILRSKDGGITWEKVLDWDYSQKHGVQVIRVNPLRAATILAGTSHGLYRSYDGGDSWTMVSAVRMVTDIEYNTADTALIMMACGNFRSTGNGLYRSTDSGDNWTRMTNGLPASYGGKALLSVYQPDPGLVYAGIGNGSSSSAGTWLCKTTDFGDNWTIMNDTNYASYQGWFAHDVAVYPGDPDTVICVGVEGWRSDDGGESLNHITGIGSGTNIHADMHALLFQPGSPRTFYIASDGGIYRSVNLGKSFERLDDGLQTSQFYNGFSNSTVRSTRSLGGLQDNGTYHYKGSTDWTYEFGGDGSWTAINPANDNRIYVSWQYLRIQRSFDGGSSFTDIRPPEDGPVSFIAPFVLAPSQPDIIYAGRSRVYKSVNSGNTWEVTNNGNELDGNPVICMAASCQNPSKIYAATAPRYGHMHLFVTFNGGDSWTNITGSLPDRFPVDLAVNPQNDEVIYVTFSGFGSSHLFKSMNHGISWIDVGTDLPDLPTSAVVVDPDHPDFVFAGNDQGVWFSYNGGESWQNYSDGLPPAVIVKDLSISEPNRKLRLATHGNGVWETDLPDVSVVNSIRAKDNNLKVYPNPFKERLSIEVSLSGNEPAEVSLVTTGGKVAWWREQNVIEGSNRISLANLNVPPGIYILVVRQGRYFAAETVIKDR